MITNFRKMLFGFSVVAIGMSTSVSAADIDAAKVLARESNCFKCHGIEKKKDGPAWKDVALKYRGNPDAIAILIKHVTTAPNVKFPDGHEEQHTTVKSKNPDEIKNLVEWILSLQ